MADNTFFEVRTPLGLRVRVTHDYWDLITTVRHPVMQKRETDVQDVLQTPDEIRESRSDQSVLLFYKLERPGRWICAVAKRLDNDEGFLITAYPTDAIKEGKRIWSR